MGVIWITGLPNAGKTTIATHVQHRLGEISRTPVLFDGDVLRSILPCQVGHTKSERRRLAEFYGRLAQAVGNQGHDVIFATVSLFHEVHAWNRRNIVDYFEVLIVAPPEDLLDRDSRGIYANTQEVIGMDIVAEMPIAPDLVVLNAAGTNLRDAGADIAEKFLSRSQIR
ncbi:adenylyl-sulfate kinase [Nocardia gipuzkoensis]